MATDNHPTGTHTFTATPELKQFIARCIPTLTYDRLNPDRSVEIAWEHHHLAIKVSPGVRLFIPTHDPDPSTNHDGTGGTVAIPIDTKVYEQSGTGMASRGGWPRRALQLIVETPDGEPVTIYATKDNAGSVTVGITSGQATYTVIVEDTATTGHILTPGVAQPVTYGEQADWYRAWYTSGTFMPLRIATFPAPSLDVTLALRDDTVGETLGCSTKDTYWLAITRTDGQVWQHHQQPLTSPPAHPTKPPVGSPITFPVCPYALGHLIATLEQPLYDDQQDHTLRYPLGVYTKHNRHHLAVYLPDHSAFLLPTQTGWKDGNHPRYAHAINQIINTGRNPTLASPRFVDTTLHRIMRHHAQDPETGPRTVLAGSNRPYKPGLLDNLFTNNTPGYIDHTLLRVAVQGIWAHNLSVNGDHLIVRGHGRTTTLVALPIHSTPHRIGRQLA